MSEEKMRAEFEAWFAGQFQCPPEKLAEWRTNEPPESGFPYRSGDPDVDNHVCCAWLGWQASRACLVVELPDPAKARDIAYFHADTLDALQSAGIPTK